MYKTLVSLNVLFLFLTLASLVQAQQAGITFVSQERSVEYSRDLDFILGGGFEIFNFRDQNNSGGSYNASFDGESYQSSDPNGSSFPFPPPGVAASQSSNITFNSITASGMFTGFTEADTGPNAFVLDQGASSLEIVFDLDGPASYSLDFSSVGFVQEVRFHDPDFNFSVFALGNTVSQSGVLDPGRYILTAKNPLRDFGEPTSGSFEIDLQINAVPEPSAFILLLGAGFGFAVRRRRKTD